MQRLGWSDLPQRSPSRVIDYTQNREGRSDYFSLRSWTHFLPKAADGLRGGGRFPRDGRHFHPSALHPDRNPPYHEKAFGEDYCFEAENGYVGKSLIAWSRWFRAQTGVDGFRLDAVKLMEPTFLNQFAADAHPGNGFFLVGEFWDTNSELLAHFQQATHRQMSLFDFGLFYALWDMTEKPREFDMRTLLTRRLADRSHAVAFVSNHDVERFQPIRRDRRTLPYALIMVMDGRPSIFYADYFRAQDPALPPALERLVTVHNRFAVGKEIVRFADRDILALERERNLLALFHGGGSDTPRTLTVPTAFGAGVLLRTVGAAPDESPVSVTTSASGSATVTIAPGRFVLLARADASERSNPDRFARRALLTTQTTEFADDLDTGRLGDTPRIVPLTLAQGTALTADVLSDETGGDLHIELRNAAGRVVARTHGSRGRKVTLAVRHIPSSAAYVLRITAPGKPTTGRVTVRYQGPERLP